MTAQSHSSHALYRVGRFRNPVYVDFFPVFGCILLLKTGSLDNAIQDFLLSEPLWCMSQYTIIYKFGKCTRQIKFKKELKKSMAAIENRLTPELNEKKVIELLENVTPASIKKATKVARKYFKLKT